MAQAVIAASKGMAFFHDGSEWQAIYANQPESIHPVAPQAMAHFTHDVTHLKFGSFPNREKVVDQLLTESERLDAVDTVLNILDNELPGDVREYCAAYLEETPEVFEYLENFFYAAHLPDEADLEGAKNACAEAQQLLDFFKRWEKNQGFISRVVTAWDALPDDLFSPDKEDAPAERRVFRHKAMEAGLFAGAVKALAGGGNLNVVKLQAVMEMQQIWGHRNVITQWFGAMGGEKISQNLVHETTKPEKRRARSKSRPKKKKSSGLDALQSIQKQKDAILAALQQGNRNRVEKYLQDLRNYQLENGGAPFLAKSLCDLAKAAQDMGAHDFQLELTREARQLAPEDPQTGTQLAHALLHNNQLDEALALYNDISNSHPHDVVALTGRAETLKALGRPQDALAAYDDATLRFPHNVVALNGRAETLRALGRLEDALTAYDDAALRHPQNIVALNGRAETLKALSRLQDALAAYDDAALRFPHDVVALNGRAETLRALGRTQDALSAYDEAARRFPHNVVALTGRAETLKALGRLQDALAAYDDAALRHPHNVVVLRGRAEIFRALGRLDDALSAYDDAYQRQPNDVITLTGRAETLKALSRFEEAEAAYRDTIKRFPFDQPAKNGLATLLVQMDRDDEALELFITHEPQTLDDWINTHIKGMMFLKQGKYQEAHDLFEHGLQNGPFKQKNYNKGALALAKLGLKKAEDALSLLNENDTSSGAMIIRFHAFGLRGDQAKTKQTYETLSQRKDPKLETILNSMANRFIHHKTGVEDDASLFKLQVNYHLGLSLAA